MTKVFFIALMLAGAGGVASADQTYTQSGGTPSNPAPNAPATPPPGTPPNPVPAQAPQAAASSPAVPPATGSSGAANVSPSQIPLATKVPGAIAPPTSLPPGPNAGAMLPQAASPQATPSQAPLPQTSPPPPTSGGTGSTNTEVITVTTTTQRPPDPAGKKSVFSSPFRKLFALVKTDLGDFRIELFHSHKPITVENFVRLAEGTKDFRDLKTGRTVRRPFYDGLIFHRAIRGTLIQSGCPFGDGRGGPGHTIQDESNDFGSVEEGSVLMARSSGKAKNSAGSQFYIMLRALPDLTDQDTIFGKVVQGIEVVRKISEVKVDRSDRPVKPVAIKEVIIQKDK